MSKTNYPNRNALREAHDIYLDAVSPFISKCLDELQDTTAVEEKIEISNIAHLVRTYWHNCFEDQFKAIDPYYEARSAIGLIVEGRNRASHPPWDLDLEFTRAQLFLIAEVLEKINRPDAQREVETIRNDLFENTTQQLVEMAVEEEKAQHKKAIAEVKERLTAEEKKNDKLSKQETDNTAKLKKKEEDLEKLSEQLVGVKLSEKKYKTQLNSKSKQLKKAQAAHSTCEERLTSTETERDDYKERLETASEQLDEVSENLSITSDQLLAAKAERDTSTEHLAAIQKLLTASTISDQSVYPPLKTCSAVRILDRRGVEKKNYLLELLEQKDPTIIYVQSGEMADLLLERVIPEKVDLIEKHGEQTSESEEIEILEQLENGKLIAVVSDTTFSTMSRSHCVEHFVFCHLAPGLDEFFKRCEPAFTSGKSRYLHLIYNREQDIEGLDKWLAQKYPDREVLVKMYRELKKLAGANGDFIKTENAYSELDMEKPSIETGLAVFAELQLLERNGEIIKFLPSVNTDLNKSTTHRRGEKLKEETADFQNFQLEHSLEQIWEEMLAKLSVDSEQILEASRVYEVHAFQDAIEDSGVQSEPSTNAVENDSKSDAEVSEAQSDRSTETVDDDNTVDGEDVEVKQPPKSTRVNAKATKEQGKEKKLSIADRFRANTTETDRNEIAVKVVELRINEEGSKPAWKKIRKELGLEEDEFHKVIRPSDGYREAVIERIKKLRAQDGGWEYSGKLEVLTGIELTEEELA